MKLSLKLWLYFIMSSLVAVLLFFSLVLTLGKLSSTGYTDETLASLAADIIEELEVAGAEPSSLAALMEKHQAKHPALEFEWLNTSRQILYSSNSRSHPYPFTEFSELFVGAPFNLWSPEQPIHLIYSAKSREQVYYLLMHVPNEAMQERQVHIYIREWSLLTILTLMVPFLVFIITPYFFTYFFFRSLRKRLHRLNEGLSNTTLVQQIEIEDTSKDEIGQLARHFNAMSKRIQEQVALIQQQENKRKTLISNLSHDLRTPLTHILGYADTISKGLYRNEGELQAHAEVIVLRSQYMEKLIHTLFEVSKLDLHGIELKKQPTALPKILRKTLAEYLPLLELHQFETNLYIPDISTPLVVDPHLIERALRNLLDNVLSYGASGKYLEVAYQEAQTHVEISIADRGKGIAAEHLPYLFDRFYQGSQNRKSQNFGLGLSIVKEIVSAHEGEVTVTSIPHQETRFTLILPKSE
ncbi:HAMP domain-containing sensor histidine kinase [Marinicrinis sediminis]|uniref:histidine kinase n=1 Tax=Marinicrinis sediminis TaxID=1652465 RepID=A0ABW5R9Q2_9BACL